MLHKRLWISAAILGLIVVLGFMLSVPHTREIAAPLAQKKATTIPAITLVDTYRKGVHTLSGSVLAPNACASLGAQASLAGDASTTQSIMLALTMPDIDGVCLQVPTSVSYLTTLAAPKDLPVAVTFNGMPATTTTP